MHENHEILTHLDRHRYVAVSEHRTVHIHWQNLSLAWQIRDFRRFAYLIEQHLQLKELPEPTVQLRINRFSVGLPTAEFLMFADMVLAAHEVLEGWLHQQTAGLPVGQMPTMPLPFALN